MAKAGRKPKLVPASDLRLNMPGDVVSWLAENDEMVERAAAQDARPCFHPTRASLLSPAARERNRVSNISSRDKTYWGLGKGDYDRMLSQQSGGCAICGRSREHNGRRLAVDHCHKTNTIRGLLCIRCNLGVGSFLDAAWVLRRATAYLENPPFKVPVSQKAFGVRRKALDQNKPSRWGGLKAV